MRNPNGFGSVKKLSGKRRRPYAAVVTVGFEKEARPDLGPLRSILSPGVMAAVEREVSEHFEGLPVYRQKTAVIGYFATKTEALLALAEYNKRPFDVRARDVSLADVWAAVSRNRFGNLKKVTVEGYSSAWKNLAPLHDRKIRDLRASDMQAVVDSFADKSQSTQRGMIKVLHFLFKYALESDWVEKDYSRFVSVRSSAPSRVRRPFSYDEIAVMLQDPERFGPLLVLIYTGLRIGEFLALRPEDVDLERRIITIHGTKTKAADRLVPIHRDIVPLVLPSIYPSLSYKGFAKRFHKMRKEQGWDHIIHETRHTFASVAQASGLDPYYIKQILGHESGDLTKDVYTHVFEARLLREIDRFDITGGGVISFPAERVRA